MSFHAGVSVSSQIRRFQTRGLIKWGRRLRTWPHGSPRVVVQGQLGWHDADTLRLSQAAVLCARLLCLPSHCFAVQLAQFALNQPRSCVREVLGELSLLGVPHPHAYGIHLGSPATTIKPWLRTVKTLLTRHADRHYSSLLQECSSFQQYALLATQARLAPCCLWTRSCNTSSAILGVGTLRPSPFC